MCGITGIINLDRKPVNQRVLLKMTEKLNHRGPDDEGFFVEKNIGLGHRRLAIIDLSPLGHQPMFYDRNKLVIVFNGEIYNYLEIRQELIQLGYHFKSHSDTEVILAAYLEWGTDCLKKFNGMWAFALYDREKDLLFCSRDRLGVKPFYYYYDKNYFIFASEAKAILIHPQVKVRPNEQAIWDYLICGHLDHRHETFFEGIKDLRGGHYLILKDNKIEIFCYWDLKKIPARVINEKEAAEEFRRLISDSVHLRLRSDVPIGTCLSGGLDSSTIVCLINDFLKQEGIKQIGQHQKTFSSCYNPQKFPNCDESQFIRSISQKTKATSYRVFPTAHKLIKDLQDLIYCQDFPIGSTSIYAQYTVFRLAHQKNMKVMLDGQGADELLAGYHTFFPVYFQALKEKGQYWELLWELLSYRRIHHQSLKKLLINLFLPREFLKKFKLTSPIKLKSPHYDAYYDYSVFNDGWKTKFVPFNFPKPNKNPFKDQSYNLIVNNGLPSLLRYEDRNSMVFGIESRTPFLDYRLVEFVYSLPDNFKIQKGQTKWVMRQALRGILPEKIRLRQDKIGFATPEEIWFKTVLKNQMKEIFLSKKFRNRPFFKPQKVIEAFEKFQKNEPLLYQLFWRAYNLELWLRRFID